ncbi:MULTISPECIES: BPSS1780 family membrane protein [Xenorhabdus]|uniref:BPSS1780 family membrane protein n=1 Tax=Xenorhabdus TaxID=626 RepID=UPI00064ABBC2|nr:MULTISPECIES: BPSS1780 family membrane protein [Xenorhabdus]KLU16617.1 membrane protein [Xenorhabdus griffiniae]KOP32586.1 membrane protein [Xenorhabdus sp. GDc328]
MDTQDMNLNSGENNISLSKEKDTFIPGGRAVGAGAATEWIGNAWEMFKAKPLKWILLYLIYFVIIAILQFIPIVSLVTVLFGSVFIAGFIAASEKQRTTGDFDIELLFHGFKNKFGSLVAVGGLVIGIYILGVIAAFVLGGTSLIQVFLAGPESDPMLIMGGLSTLTLALLVVLFFSIIALAFSWFAPALIIINDLKFGEAVSMSLSAVKKNLFGGFLFFLLMGILMFISAIPLGLGLLVTLPMFMATYYTTYRSIFYAPKTQETKSHLIN